MKISMIAAHDKNGAIGKDGDIPWRGDLPADIGHFKRLTLGKPVIMGRKTWESLPDKFQPLPGRENIVLTRNESFESEGCTVAHSVEEALEAASWAKEVFVIGGEEIYNLFFPYADKLCLTIVNTNIDGDTYFPEFDLSEWTRTERLAKLKNALNKYSCTFVTYERKRT